MVGPPVMQPKAGAVKAPELSPRGRGVVVIKFLGLVRVDATYQSTALGISLFTPFKWATSYVGVDIFYFVCSHLLQSLKRLIFGNGGSTTHACMHAVTFLLILACVDLIHLAKF